MPTGNLIGKTIGGFTTGEGFSLLAPISGYPIVLRSNTLFPDDVQEFSIVFDRSTLLNPTATGLFPGLLTLGGLIPLNLELETSVEDGPPATGYWLVY